jgi:hypothetical protein
MHRISFLLLLAAACATTSSEIEPRVPTSGKALPAAVPGAGPAPTLAVPRGRAAPGADGEQDFDRKLVEFVRAHMGEVKDCYARALRRNADLSGKFFITFSIQPDGSTADVATKRSTLADSSVAACVVRLFASLQTPFHPDQPVLVEYPLVFSAR